MATNSKYETAGTILALKSRKNKKNKDPRIIELSPCTFMEKLFRREVNLVHV